MARNRILLALVAACMIAAPALATDARLRAALAPRVADAAVLVVAQRVSTIRNADQIIVLEDGAIVGLGPHDELLVTSPTYAEIVASQHAGVAA